MSDTKIATEPPQLVNLRELWRIGRSGERTDGMRMPIITLHQPWAFWVALGWKTIETRTHNRFRSLEGHRIGIHVGLQWDNDALRLASPYLTEEQISQTRNFLRVGGNVICTAYVGTATGPLSPRDAEAALIECQTERYGLFLKDIVSVPVSDATCFKGKQGIWYADICLETAEAAKGRTE